MTTSAFYAPLGENRFRATDATVGPWSADLQHGGPPAALLGRLIERALPRDDARVGRVAFDFLGPVAVGDVSLEVSIERAGARIELSRGRLSVNGRGAMQASAWRIATQPGRVPAIASGTPAIPPLPPPQPRVEFHRVPQFGYADAIEWRFAEGAFDALGPAIAWARPRLPLVEGEATSPLARLLLIVDSANGISAELEPSRFTFVPVELTVAIHRYPRTEWIGMRARTTVESDGVGLVRADLFDEEGPLGTAMQTLFVAPR
jgi:hypothetical protein